MAKLKEEYANALIQLSIKEGSMVSDLEKGILLRDSLSSEEIQNFLEHPEISKEQKHKLLHQVYEGNIPEHILGFMDLMLEQKKESTILPVLNEYVDSINKRLGRIDAVVVSANELTDRQKESIKHVLSKQRNMEVNLITKVDKEVIGGFYILIDGHIFDGTVRNELNIMRESLKKGSNNVR